MFNILKERESREKEEQEEVEWEGSETDTLPCESFTRTCRRLEKSRGEARGAAEGCLWHVYIYIKSSIMES